MIMANKAYVFLNPRKLFVEIGAMRKKDDNDILEDNICEEKVKIMILEIYDDFVE